MNAVGVERDGKTSDRGPESDNRTVQDRRTAVRVHIAVGDASTRRTAFGPRKKSQRTAHTAVNTTGRTDGRTDERTTHVTQQDNAHATRGLSGRWSRGVYEKETRLLFTRRQRTLAAGTAAAAAGYSVARKVRNEISQRSSAGR